jgi:hypothetical protein
LLVDHADSPPVIVGEVSQHGFLHQCTRLLGKGGGVLDDSPAVRTTHRGAPERWM